MNLIGLKKAQNASPDHLSAIFKIAETPRTMRLSEQLAAFDCATKVQRSAKECKGSVFQLRRDPGFMRVRWGLAHLCFAQNLLYTKPAVGEEE